MVVVVVATICALAWYVKSSAISILQRYQPRGERIPGQKLISRFWISQDVLPRFDAPQYTNTYARQTSRP